MFKYSCSKKNTIVDKDVLIDETIDLYWYRLAEKKAIKLGKITRLLKEVAVDCLINHEQANFTDEKMLENKNNRNITQLLSTGEKIASFPVGDKPNTSACDFMENCEISCTSVSKSPSLSLNDDSNTNNTSNYNELFISTNTDNIMLKIQNLMKIKHFYKKQELICYINSATKYPLTQINYTLTQMIENNGRIIDKYDRIGKLINIGDYYLFQPDDLKNNYISLYDRSTPISRKPYSVQIISDTFKDKPGSNIVKESGSKVLENILSDFNKIIESVHNKTDTWHNYAYITMKHLIDTYNIELTDIHEFLIEHICDKLSNSNIVALLNDVFINPSIKNPSNKDDGVVCEISNNIDAGKYSTFFMNIVQNAIYQKMVITNDNHIVFGMSKYIGAKQKNPDPKNVLEIYIYFKDENKWEPAGQEDIKNYIDIVSTKYKKYTDYKEISVDGKEIQSNKYVGFMSFNTDGSDIIFYVWIKNESGTLGFRCEQHDTKKLKNISELIESEIYLIVPTTESKRTSSGILKKNNIRCWRIANRHPEPLTVPVVVK